MKTNGARFLESLGIAFELREYEVDPNDLTAITVARKIGHACGAGLQDAVDDDRRRRLCVCGGSWRCRTGLQEARACCGLRKVEMSPLKDVQPLTGYIRGGVTVFGAKKAYPVFVDETAILFDRISVSAGTRGTQLILAPEDYLRAAAVIGEPVETVDLTKEAKSPSEVHHDARSKDSSRQGSAHRMAFARRHDLDAVLLRTCGCAVLDRFRSSRRVRAADCWRSSLRCDDVRFSERAESSLVARDRHQVMDAQRMVPAPAAELYLAKVMVNFLFVTIVQIVLAPFFFVFYNLHIAGNAWLLVLVLPLGTWALVGNGVFFAALSMSSRNRELLLSLILFPIFIPALLAMVQATTSIFTGESDPTLWIKMLLGYDIIFTTASLLLFDVVFHAE